MKPPVTESGEDPIAIVGMAMRLPGGVNSGDEFWDLLVNKRSGHCRVPENRYNIDGFYTPTPKPGGTPITEGYYLQDVDYTQFDTSFFTTSKKELERQDPQQRQLLEV